MKNFVILLGVASLVLVLVLIYQLNRYSEMKKFAVDEYRRLVELQDEIRNLKLDSAIILDEKMALKYLGKYGAEVKVGKVVKFGCEEFLCKAEYNIEMDEIIKISDDQTKLVTYDGHEEFLAVELEPGFEQMYISSWNEYGIVVSLKSYDRGVGLIDTYYLKWESGFEVRQLERCQWSIRKGVSFREIDWCKQVNLSQTSKYIELNKFDGTLN